MQTSVRHIVFAIILILTASSCANRKLTSTKPVKADATTLLAALDQHGQEFEYYSGKAKMKVETELMRVGATVHLRMIRDSVIWAKIDKLGFELGRALITPDSAFVMDRINKEYYVESLDEFLATYHAPFTFDDLQRVLAGGTLNGHSDDVQIVPGETGVGLQMRTDAFEAKYWFNQSLQLERGTFTDPEQRRVALGYGDYRNLGAQQPMPFERMLELDDGVNFAEIGLSFAEIELDVPKSIPFNIPNHYAKVE